MNGNQQKDDAMVQNRFTQADEVQIFAHFLVSFKLFFGADLCTGLRKSAPLTHMCVEPQCKNLEEKTSNDNHCNRASQNISNRDPIDRATVAQGVN